jgi:hypothetical protein
MEELQLMGPRCLGELFHSFEGLEAEVARANAATLRLLGQKVGLIRRSVCIVFQELFAATWNDKGLYPAAEKMNVGQRHFQYRMNMLRLQLALQTASLYSEKVS